MTGFGDTVGEGVGDAVTEGDATGEADARGEADGVGVEETDRETVAEGDAVGEGAPFTIDPAQRPNRRRPEKAMALLGDIVITR